MTETILKIENLDVNFGYGHQSRRVVEQVNFALTRGETFALVGESGSGKSVTAHSILQLLPYPYASHSAESAIFFEGQNLLRLNETALNKIRGKRISMIFQEPMTALNPLHTVEKQIGEIISLHRGLRGDALRQEVIHQLERVRIPRAMGKLNAYPHQLSGGQRQRVMIAMALANQPDLLIADEPTTALDVTVQKQIMTLLKELQQEAGMTLLLITHDLGVVRHFSDRMAVMQNGKIVEQGPCEDVFTRPVEAYTRLLLESEPKGSAIQPPASSDTILSTRELSVRFPLHKPLFKKPSRFLVAVDDVELDIIKGQTLGIVGESGSGKSTLAMALLRLLNSEGSINFHGQSLQNLNQKALRPLRRQMQVVFQDPFASLSPRLTVQQIIAEGLVVHTRMSRQDIEAAVIKSMEDVGLDPEFRHRYPHEFSGGQRQRIAIARALILSPEIIVLDEPTSALDRAVQVQVIDLLRKLQEQYHLTYLFISHDLKVIRAISHQVVVMRNGRIVERAATDKLFSQPEQEYTRELLSATLS
ncbi:MAG: ABC transporter ATP-binding protein [Cellvibrio sp.]|jgi:microcin C transport system ATP-binding protein